MDKIKILGQTYNIIEKDMKNEEVIFGEIDKIISYFVIWNNPSFSDYHYQIKSQSIIKAHTNNQ